MKKLFRLPGHKAKLLSKFYARYPCSRFPRMTIRQKALPRARPSLLSQRPASTHTLAGPATPRSAGPGCRSPRPPGPSEDCRYEGAAWRRCVKDVSDGQGGETDTVLKCPQLHTDTLEGRKINTPRNIQGNQQVEGILFDSRDISSTSCSAFKLMIIWVLGHINTFW